MSSTASQVEGQNRDARIAELEQQVTELEDRWRRAAADLDNLWKRFNREMMRKQGEERARVTAEWLPVLDHIELALEHSGVEAGPFLDGVRSVRDQAVALLERLGYHRIDEVGVPFDPSLHEAVATTSATEAEPGTVVRIVRPGYGEGERQLRPAAVVVASGNGSRDEAEG
jgi:molecular chaperone GrpE